MKYLAYTLLAMALIGSLEYQSSRGEATNLHKIDCEIDEELEASIALSKKLNKWAYEMMNVNSFIVVQQKIIEGICLQEIKAVGEPRSWLSNKSSIESPMEISIETHENGNTELSLIFSKPRNVEDYLKEVKNITSLDEFLDWVPSPPLKSKDVLLSHDGSKQWNSTSRNLIVKIDREIGSASYIIGDPTKDKESRAVWDVLKGMVFARKSIVQLDDTPYEMNNKAKKALGEIIFLLENHPSAFSYFGQSDSIPAVQDDNGNSDLLEAASRGDVNAVRALADQALGSQSSRRRSTPLHKAAMMGEIKVVKMLIDAGADVNAEDNYGTTPLHLVLGAGHSSPSSARVVVKMLIDAGADVNAEDDYGMTPLNAAVFKGDVVVIETLIDAGADVQNKRKLCELWQNLKVCRELDSRRSTPLHKAAMMGEIKEVKRLIDAGADVNAEDDNGTTPLHFGVWSGHSAPSSAEVIVNMLIDAGADVNAENDDRITPLHVAITTGYVVVIETLIDAGADVNVKNNHGLTPFHLIIKIGDHDSAPPSTEVIVNMLIDAGADVHRLQYLFKKSCVVAGII